MPALIAGASDQLRESMLGIAKTLAQLERAKRAARQARARVWAEMAAQREKDKKKGMGNPPKKPRKDPVMARVDDEDEEEDDLKEVLEKGKHKRTTKSLYTQLPTTSGYATTGQDRSARMLV